MSSLFFHRTAFAKALTKKLLAPDVLETTIRDGLFITGPRRIGKTTFIKQDLIPELGKNQALVIYADLWKNNDDMSPSKTVLSSVRTILKSLASSTTKLRELKINLKLISFTFDTERIGTDSGVSLADALLELISKIDRNIVLIIDEIQESLRSQAGRNLLAALKAARDAVNLRPNNPNGTFLLVVGTGSHRSFVSAMASRSSQPFYGADRADFPLLGSDFVEWQIRQLPHKDKIPAREVLLKGFSILGFRPKTFRQVLLEIQHYEGTEINQAFLAVCRNQARADAAEFLEPLGQSDTLTKLLFTEIAKAGPKGCSNLFSTNCLEQLTKACGKQKTISASTVQGKLLQMQKNDWIYPSGYGCYAVSDPQAGAVWLEDCDDGRNLLSDPEKT